MMKEYDAMNTMVMTFLGTVVGLVAGIALFDRGPGIEPLPFLLAIGGAFAVASVARVIRRGSASA